MSLDRKPGGIGRRCSAVVECKQLEHEEKGGPERDGEGDYLLEEGVVDLLYGADFDRLHHPASRDDNAAENLGWGGHTVGSPAGWKENSVSVGKMSWKITK